MYQQSRIVLFSDGTGLIIRGKERCRVQNVCNGKIYLQRLAIWNNKLYGLADGSIYVLKSSPQSGEKQWKWDVFGKWSNVSDLCATGNSCHLWLVDKDGGHLLDEKESQLLTNKCYQRRYGYNKNSYVEFVGTGNILVYVDGALVSQHQQIRDAVLDAKDNLHTLTSNNRQWQGIAIVDGQPEYY